VRKFTVFLDKAVLTWILAPQLFSAEHATRS
jgi:hypothetical protein